MHVTSRGNPNFHITRFHGARFSKRVVRVNIGAGEHSTAGAPDIGTPNPELGFDRIGRMRVSNRQHQPPLV